MPQLSAASLMVSRACFLVQDRPAAAGEVAGELLGGVSRRSVFCRSMMWIPPRSPNMKRRILGFQRRVWWPKWTPASSSSLMPISVAKELLPWLDDVCPPAGSRTRALPGQGRGRCCPAG